MQLRREVGGTPLAVRKSIRGEQRVIAVGMIHPSRGCPEIGRGAPENRRISIVISIFHLVGVSLKKVYLSML